MKNQIKILDFTYTDNDSIHGYSRCAFLGSGVVKFKVGRKELTAEVNGWSCKDDKEYEIEVKVSNGERYFDSASWQSVYSDWNGNIYNNEFVEELIDKMTRFINIRKSTFEIIEFSPCTGEYKKEEILSFLPEKYVNILGDISFIHEGVEKVGSITLRNANCYENRQCKYVIEFTQADGCQYNHKKFIGAFTPVDDDKNYRYFECLSNAVEKWTKKNKTAVNN